jgi:hypothetical protein
MAAQAASATVTFIPPSDPVGMVFSTNSNDGYGRSRGVVFTPTSNFSLTSVGIYQDLTNVTLNFTVEAATSPSGITGPGTILRSGSVVANTTGLQFIDFAFASLNLAAGSYYNVNFSFAGNSNQNFFYNQSGAEPYAQAGFAGIDGTVRYNTGNFLLPAIRLNGSVVPEPASWALMIVGFGLVGVAARRRSTTVAA